MHTLQELGARNTCWCRKSERDSWLQTKYQHPARTPRLRISQFLPSTCLLWYSLCADSFLVLVPAGWASFYTSRWILPFSSYRGCVLWKNFSLVCLGWEPLYMHYIGGCISYFVVVAAAAVNDLREALKEGRVHCGSQFQGSSASWQGSWSHCSHSQEAGSRQRWIAMLRSFCTSFFSFFAAWAPRGLGNGDAHS